MDNKEESKEEHNENQRKEDRMVLEELQHTNTNTDPNVSLHTLDTLSQTIDALKNKGYTTNFNLQHDCLICQQVEDKVYLYPHEFEIEQVFRFEGASNPDDSSILYAIKSEKHGLKGVLVNAYGVYANEMATEMAKRFK